MSAEAERTWDALLRVHAKLLPLFDGELLAASRLPLTWYHVLRELESAGTPLRMAELGDRVLLSPSRVSRLVDDLGRAGLVVREANQDDARSSFAVLTEDGRQRIKGAAPVYLSAIEREIDGALSSKRLQQLADDLESILRGPTSSSAIAKGTLTKKPA